MAYPPPLEDGVTAPPALIAGAVFCDIWTVLQLAGSETVTKMVYIPGKLTVEGYVPDAQGLPFKDRTGKTAKWSITCAVD